MAIDILALTESHKNLLAKNNTTTSSTDLSSGLNVRVKKLRVGVDGQSDNLPVTFSSYPIVFVEVATSSEDFGEIGKGARRNVDLSFSIVGITHYGAGSGDESQGRENADKESMRLSTNIQTIFRENISVSSTVDDVNISNVTYNAKLNDNNTYNSVGKIGLTSRMRNR